MGHTEMLVIRVHTERTGLFLPPEVLQSPDTTEGQCCSVSLTSTVKEAIPVAPDKKHRQSLP